MIQATMKVNGQGYIKGYVLTGHAEAGPYGSDIVCSAVSVIAIGLVNNLERLANHKPNIQMDVENGGYLEVDFKEDQVEEPETQLLAQAYYETLLDIQKEYSEFIQIRETE